MSETYGLVQGDSAPDLIITARDKRTAATGRVLDPNDPETWRPIDLTGATVQLKLRKLGASTLTATLAGTVLSPATDGRFKVSWGAEALAETGDYEAEAEITFADSSEQTAYDVLRFYVRPQF